MTPYTYEHLELLAKAIVGDLGVVKLKEPNKLLRLLNKVIKPYRITVEVDQHDKTYWPVTQVSMVSYEMLMFLHEAILSAPRNTNVVECGVWKGGASIFAHFNIQMRTDKMTLYLCDSFAGLPAPVAVEDKNMKLHHCSDVLAASITDVQNNFKRFGINPCDNEHIKFVAGYFCDTMPTCKNTIKNIGVLRVDCDMYQSTMDVLDNLYDNVVDGGYIIIDDYNAMPESNAAIDYFINKRKRIYGETIKLRGIEGSEHGCYWVKGSIINYDDTITLS